MTESKIPDNSVDGVEGASELADPNAHNLQAGTHHPLTTSDRIRQFSRMGTNQALQELGDPDQGGPRSASAMLELDSVSSSSPYAHPRHRRMKIGVTVSVAPDGSCPPTPDSPVPPCPPHKPGRSNKWPWLVVIVLLLTLLILTFGRWGSKSSEFAFGLFSGTTSTASNISDTPSTPADHQTSQNGNNDNQRISAVPISPTALRLDDTVMPANTVQYDQGPDAGCDGDYHDVNQVPGFAIVHTQNWVRTAATQWQVKCLGNLGGATVVALDSSHNVINRQVYGANFLFVEQLVFVQSTDSAGFRIEQVDFYAPFNTFLGRTIYRFDASNRISDAYRQDGFQRPLQASHFTRDQNGVVTSVDTEKTVRGGGGRTRSYTLSDIEAATRVYYAYDSFN